MKKYLLFLLIIFVGLFSFACDDNNINKEEPNGDENKTNNEEDPKEEKCVVSFYLDDNLFVRIEIDKNTKIDRPTDPTIDDAIFDGWFTKDDVDWDFETPISSDLSIFGKYHYEEVITFYVDWLNDEDQNENDTKIGTKSADPKLEIPIEITFEQYNG